MELFLDTADAQAVKEFGETLNIAGVTTNPTIITKSGKTPEQVIDQMCAVLAPEQKFFMQVVAEDVEGMLEDARAIASIRPNMVVKIPVNQNGYRAMKLAKAEGIAVLATGIYSPEQAFLAAMNGVDYMAPYVNRMCNYGDGVSQVAELQVMLENYGMEAKVCAASFKNVQQVHELLVAGIASATIAPDIVRAMFGHAGTAVAIQEFSSAWKASFGRTSFAK